MRQSAGKQAGSGKQREYSPSHENPPSNLNFCNMEAAERS
jgi:hypothetical protein